MPAQNLTAAAFTPYGSLEAFIRQFHPELVPLLHSNDQRIRDMQLGWSAREAKFRSLMHEYNELYVDLVSLELIAALARYDNNQQAWVIPKTSIEALTPPNRTVVERYLKVK